MSDPTDSTPRSIALRGNRSLSVGGNSLISRGLQDLANLTAAPSAMPTVLTDDIHEAARNGDNIAVRRILQNDPAKIDAKDSGECTPLHLAANEGHADTTELLLSHGAEVDALNMSDNTPLHWAAALGHTDTARLLLSHCAEVEARDTHLTCNEAWAEFADAPELFHYFSRETLSFLYPRNGYTPLHWAAEGGHTDVAKLLLSHGADVDAEDIWYQTPLHLAAEGAHTDVAKLLLSHGADVDAEDAGGETPLDHAVSEATAEMIRQHGGVSGKDVR